MKDIFNTVLLFWMLRCFLHLITSQIVVCARPSFVCSPVSGNTWSSASCHTALCTWQGWINCSTRCAWHIYWSFQPQKDPRKDSLNRKQLSRLLLHLINLINHLKNNQKQKIPLNTKRKLLSAPPLITRSHHSRFGRFFMLDALYGFCVSSCKNWVQITFRFRV